jgi:aminomethyltransferase
MCPFAGYSMPLSYKTSIINEHKHVREKAGLFDVSHMGAVLVDSLEVVDELEKILPSDLKEMKIGATKYSLLLNNNGGIEDDLLISKLDIGFLIVLNADNKVKDLAYLRGNTNCSYNDLFDYGIFAIQGPKAKDAMMVIFPRALDLKFMNVMQTQYKDKDVYISRTGYTGEDGFEIIAHPEVLEEIFSKLTSCEFIEPIGLGARDSLRLEAGLCLHGHDISSEISPIEARLSWVVGKRRREEGGFFGAGVVQRHLANGVKKKLYGFFVDSKAIAREGGEIYNKEGNKVGYVTSGLFSPSLSRPIAMGYINTEEEDKELSVDIRGNLYPVELVKLPFVPHNYFKG